MADPKGKIVPKTELDTVKLLEGKISTYQSFVVHVMKLNLPDTQIDKLIECHSSASLPPIEDISLVAGIAEGDQEILRLIRDNRGRYPTD